MAEAAPVRGTTVVPVPRKPGQPEREATLELRTTVVQVARPSHRRADTPAAPPLTVVLAREINPPDGLAPIDWLLLTTLSVETADDAARIVRWFIAIVGASNGSTLRARVGAVRSNACN